MKFQLSESNANILLIDNEDLLMEILLRLPTAESVIRCRFVSKNWYVLSSQHNFIVRFINRRIRQYSLLHNNVFRFCEYQPISTVILSYQNPQHQHAFLLPSKDPCFQSRGFNLSFLPEEVGSVCILGSFNDLLLCCARRNDYLKYYICNPFTFQSVSIPVTTKNQHGRTLFGFICDPYYSRDEKGEYAINNGYRHRVVSFTEVGKDHRAVCTYCSETGQWDESFLIGTQFQFFSNIVHYDGKLLWYNGVHVVAYDPFNGGQWSLIDGSKFKPTNHRPAGCVFSYCLGVSRGFLRMMELTTYAYGDAIGSETLSIWELKEYGGAAGDWNLQCNIYFNGMFSKNPWVQKYLKGRMLTAKALAFNPTNTDVVYLGFNERLISCNLVRGELNVVGKFPNGSLFFNGDNVFPILLPWWPTPVIKNFNV